MNDWLGRTLWIAAVAGSALFLLKLVVLMAGGGHDGDADAGGGHGDADAGHHGSSWAFQFLTVQSLATFAMGAGWAGLAVRDRFAEDDLQTIVLAALFGVALVALMIKLMASLRKLEASGTLDVRNAVGQTGVVYLTLPRTGAGQVEVVVQGRLCTLDAVSPEAPVPTGARVKVEAVDDVGRLVVVPLST
ncbi:MAG TPA: NfeD family protein [Planctomycetota bacterium]|nr:NfeD family protein [Planctomycetota bacterium]